MTIVVATDFSDEGSRAARIGALLARALAQPLHVVHVSRDPRAPLLIGTAEEHQLAEDRRKLHEAAESFQRDFGLSVITELEAGPVVSQVCAAAERQVAELLVIGAGGRTRSFMGTTAEQIVRNVRVPVLAVRAAAALEAWLTTGRPLRVLVGSDLGAAAQHAESTLSVLDRAGPLEVQVACVAHPADIHARYDLPPPQDVNVLDATAEQLLLRDLTAQGSALPWRDRRHARIIPGTARADTHLSILAQHADLVVVGVRKQSWLAEAWYGSVASGVLRTAPTSVLCVPRGLIAPVLPPRTRLRTVVAATDFSELGDEAVRVAMAISEPGATLHLVHVLSGILEDEADNRAAARRQLRQRVPADLEGRNVMSEVLVGPPAEAIVSFARRVSADSLCLGSHGRSGVAVLVLGSTAQDVLARAHIPVLIVPPMRD